MTVFSDLRRQPGTTSFTHLSATNGLTSQREDVGIIMFARIARNVHRITGGGANTRNLIRSNCAPHAGAVNYYPQIGRALSNGSGHSVCKVWVVNCLFGVGTKVVDAMSELLE